MRTSILALAIALGGTAFAAQAKPELVYFGTHTVTAAPVLATQTPAGQALPDRGIYGAWFDPSTGHFTPLGRVIDIPAPTWLTADAKRPILYSVTSGAAGSNNLISLAVDAKTGGLSVTGRSASGGGDATYLDVDPVSHSLFTANYASGQVSVLPIEADGQLGAVSSIQSDSGTGPSPRQASPHAHSAVLDPSGHYVLVGDLGADRIFVYAFDAKTRQLTPAATPFEATPPGSGPRHLVFHPNGKLVFLVSELSAEVRSYKWNASTGRLQLLQTTPLAAPDFQGKKSGGEIALSDDGRFLYISERGENQIVVFAVDATTGQLSETQRIAAQGDSPWHFAFDPSRKWFLVADEASSLITTFKVDPASGKLTPSADTLSVPRPVNVTFVMAH